MLSNRCAPLHCSIKSNIQNYIYFLQNILIALNFYISFTVQAVWTVPIQNYSCTLHFLTPGMNLLMMYANLKVPIFKRVSRNTGRNMQSLEHFWHPGRLRVLSSLLYVGKECEIVVLLKFRSSCFIVLVLRILAVFRNCEVQTVEN